MKISETLQMALTRAGKLAVEYKNQYVTPEHLLYSIVETSDGNDIITKCGVDPESLLILVDDYLTSELPSSIDDAQPDYSLGLQEVIAISATQAVSSEQKELTVGGVLAAIFQLNESDAAYLLSRVGITRLKILHVLSDLDTADENRTHPPHASEPIKHPYLEDLCEKARLNKIDPLIGRESEQDEVIQVLARRRKNNPILIGEPGVGKTAIIEGLANAITSGKVPTPLLNMTIFSLDISGLMAGTRYRGDFEERLKTLFTDLKKTPNHALFIDEIHLILGTGAISGGGTDIANLLKPLLASGDIRCIGATTTKEYRQIFEKDGALARRFQKISIEPPSIDDTHHIINGLINNFQTFHNVSYTTEAIHACVTLSDQYITDRHLPDKAVDAMDQAGAMVKLSGNTVVEVADIERVIAKMANIPSITLRDTQETQMMSLADELKKKIVGQDQAIDDCCDAILIAKSGLGNPDRPLGSFLLIGPSGVGKTEFAKQLAKSLSINLCRFDMSEYLEKHTVSRLVGAPPGYIGHDDGGQLSEAIRKHPHSVLLLDEIEKAHPDVINVLLQIMDYGTLTDSLGRKVDFRQTIIVMTSNTGARDHYRKPIGFEQSRFSSPKKAIETDFSPEFRNRLTAIIEFQPLSTDHLVKIADHHLRILAERLEHKGIILTWDETVTDHIAHAVAETDMGARKIATYIEKNVTGPLSRQVLSHSLGTPGRQSIVVRKNKMEFLDENLR